MTWFHKSYLSLDDAKKKLSESKISEATTILNEHIETLELIETDIEAIRNALPEYARLIKDAKALLDIQRIPDSLKRIDESEVQIQAVENLVRKLSDHLRKEE